MPVPVIVIGFVALLVVFLFTVAIKATQRTRQRVQDLAKKIGGSEIRHTASGTVFSGRHKGFDYFCRYFPGSKDAPPSLTIGLRHPTPGKMNITRESGFDRFGKNSGLAEEIQTGDPDFDEDFYLDTDQVDFYRQYFQKREHRSAVQALYNAGYRLHLKFARDRLAVVVSPLRDRHLADFPLERFLENLAILARGLPKDSSTEMSGPFGQDADSGEAGSSKKGFGFLAAFEIILLFSGAALLVSGLTSYKPLGFFPVWRSLVYSLPLFAFFLWFSFQMLKGRSSSHRRFLFLLLFGLLAFCLAGCGSMIFLNGKLDQNPAKTYVLPVIDKHTSKSKDSLNYHVVIRHWHPEKGTHHFSVRRSFYENVFTGEKVKIVIKPGYFGQEWLVSIEPAGGKPEAER